MAEARHTDQKTDTATPRASSRAGADDEQRREKQRQRNNELVDVQEFDGDTEQLRKSGVPEQLLKGQDPDARLIG